MRSLVFSLIVLAGVSAQAAAQRPSITRPVQQAREAAAKSGARTQTAEAVVQEPAAASPNAVDSARSKASAPASTGTKSPGTASAPTASAEKSNAPVPPVQAARGKSAPAGSKAAVTPAAGTPATNAAGTTDSRTPDSSAATVSVGSMATRPELRIDREVFSYDAGGRRDPFVSLLSTSDLRPLFSDLLLVVINYDPQRRNSVAIMRDATTKEQYRVRQGQLIGRMRVAAIEQKRVLFTIDEFGFSRQESLVIGDTTKVRKQ